MDQLWTEIAKSGSAALIIGAVVYFALRDQAKILRSMDLRLAKLLEHMRRAAPTPPQGIVTRDPTGPIRQYPRKRSTHDSDMETGESVPLARTVTDEDLDQ